MDIFSKLKDKLVIFKTLRVRLFILLILFGLIPVSVYSVISARLLLSSSISQRISELQSHAAIISNLVVNSKFFTNEDLTELNSELNQVADVYKGRILIVDSQFTVVKDTYGLEDGKIIISKSVLDTFSGVGSKKINKESKYVEITVPIRESVMKDVEGVILMSFSIENIYTLYKQNIQHSITFITVFVIMLITFAVFVVKGIMKPVKSFYKSISSIVSGGRINDQINFKGYAELSDAVDSCNEMINEMKKIDDSRQEFVSNVSHELKTPITSMKVLAESLIGQEGLDVELYKEFMQDINSELTRMDDMINDLLTLVKNEREDAANIVITTVNINDFVEGLIKTLRPIAAKRNIELVYETFRQIAAEIDEVKLGMAINNLIENAIKYNHDDGWVRISLNSDHKYFYVKVADSGVGIPEEFQTRVFDRFFRVDKARSRDTGGTGLGLAITRNVVLLHRGAIKVYSKEGQGTVFTVRIPLNFQT